MATKIKLSAIDADAHVLETEQTWDYLEPSEQKYRPLLYASKKNPTKQFWMLDNKVCGFRPPTLSEQMVKELSQRSGRNVGVSQTSEELDDVTLRVAHMDKLGTDVQVLHNSFWIEQVTKRAEVEVALSRSWNRWLADTWKQGKGRLLWSCVVPTLSIQDCIEQIRFSKENGAVAVCLRPVEGERMLPDPYFYPIYEEASRLDMAIVVHVANGNPANCELWRGFRGHKRNPVHLNGLPLFRVPTALSCFQVLVSEIPLAFPKLRWGFIEASAMWVPWMLREALQRCEEDGRPIPEDAFKKFNIFVSCQTNDDLQWLIQYIGDDNIVIGTDYGHTDSGSEVDAMSVLKDMENLTAQTKEKILCHNPKSLYGL